MSMVSFKQQHFRNLLGIGLAVLLALVGGHGATRTVAQNEPTALIDAMLSDISVRTGKTVNRSNINYTWEQRVFPDSSLGCPQAGAAYAQAQTIGYIVVITPFDPNSVFDYRGTINANAGGNIFWLCTINGAPPPASAATTVAPPPVATLPPPPTPAPTLPPFVQLSAPVLFYADVANNGNGTLARYDGTTLTSLVPVMNDSQPLIAAPKWSPDGSRLVFSKRGRESGYYMLSNGQAPRLVFSNNTGSFDPASKFPAAWSPDGKLIGYPVPTTQVDPNTPPKEILIQIQAVEDVGTAPQYAGTITFTPNAGGRGYSLPEGAYYRDAGEDGNALSLVWTPLGFVHSIDWDGIGLALSDFRGGRLWTQPNLKRLVVTADRLRGIALVQPENAAPRIGGSALSIVDLATGAQTMLVNQPNIDQMTITPDGQTVLYSTSTPLRTVEGAPNTVVVGGNLLMNYPGPYSVNQVALWSVPLAGGTPTKIFETEGYVISSIQAVSATNDAIFTLVTAENVAVERLNAGGTEAEAAALLPAPSLWRVTLNPAAAAVGLLALNGSNLAIGTAPQFTALRAGSTGAPVVVNASALRVGGTASVNVKPGDSLNLRITPSRIADVLRTLKGGEIVTLVAGPQDVDGLRWWQVRTADGMTGWVIEQITENNITETLLIPFG